MTGKSSAARVWGLAFVAAAVAIAVHAATHRGEVFVSGSDESLLHALAVRAHETALYAGDRWLDICADVFSKPYAWLAGFVFHPIVDPVTATRVLAVPFHAVFLAGCFRVGERLGGRAGGVLALLLAVLPPFGAPLLLPGGSLPRDVVFALLPWFWLAARDAWKRGAVRTGVVFLALGIVANIHPLTALHAFGLMTATEFLVAPSRRSFGMAVVATVAFGIGAGPYIAQFSDLPKTPGMASADVLRWRIFGIGSDSPSAWMARMEPAIWAAAAALVLTWRRRTEDEVRALLAALGVALLGAAACPLVGKFMASLQTDRFVRFALWCAAMLVAGEAVGAWRAGRRAAVVQAALAVALVGWGAVVVGEVVPGEDGLRGPLADVARRVERRIGKFDPPTPDELGLPRRATPGDPGKTEAARDGFVAVCGFIRDRTPPGSVFLVPPEEWGAFRSYARRGCVVTRKEGGAATTFLGGRGADWFREYAESIRLYASGAPADWAATAKRYDATYAVVEEASAAPAWPVEFESGPYRVLRVPK